MKIHVCLKFNGLNMVLYTYDFTTVITVQIYTTMSELDLNPGLQSTRVLLYK